VSKKLQLKFEPIRIKIIEIICQGDLKNIVLRKTSSAAILDAKNTKKSY